MSELREVIARASWEAECEAWGPYRNNPMLELQLCPYDELGHSKQLELLKQADTILRALSEAGRTYEQGVADGRAERDGRDRTHSASCWSFGRHHYECALNQIEALSAQLAQAREALDRVSENCDRSDLTPASALAGIRRIVRTTLAALTAGSTEGKDD